MEDIKKKKQEIREDVQKQLESFSEEELAKKSKALETKIFEFANFMEANIAMLFIDRSRFFDTVGIIKRCHLLNKVVALPAFDDVKKSINLFKVDDPETDLIEGPRGFLEPTSEKCKVLPIDCIDIAVIPGIAFDEKGGRIGSGEGYYDRFIPTLPITTRKVSLVFEDQIVQQVPMESHDKHVDIIITDQRVIYKI